MFKTLGSGTSDDQPDDPTSTAAAAPDDPITSADSSQCVACNKVGQVGDNHHKVVIGKTSLTTNVLQLGHP